MSPDPAELSVVIPSRDRPAAVERQIRHWRDSRVRVYLLDNGEQGLAESVTRQMAPNISYEHRPGQFLEQLASVSDVIETPYAMYCDDDNILLSTGLWACMNVLGNDPELAFVWGRTAKFVPFAGKVYVAETYQRNTTTFSDSDDSLARVRGHFDAYEPSAWYAVHRREAFGRLNLAAVQLLGGCTSGYAAEVGVEGASFFLGKSRQTPHLTLLRSLENRPIDLGSSFRGLGFSEWWNSPVFGAEVAGFEEVLRHWCSDGNHSQREITELLEVIRIGPGAPIPRSKAGSASMMSQRLPTRISKGRGLRLGLEHGARVKRSLLWWLHTVASAQAACLLADLRRRPGRIVRSPGWSADTVVDWDEIDSLAW